MTTRTQTSRRNWGKVVHEGMGGFLNPPTHPEHNYSVRSVYGDTFSMSLTAAVESDWLDDETRNHARSLLNSWKPLPLGNPGVQNWIHQTLGYFHDCYVGQDKQQNSSWSASDLRIMTGYDPVLNQDIHAGVHLIRKYYADYVATEQDFKQAYWGKKPVAV